MDLGTTLHGEEAMMDLELGKTGGVAWGKSPSGPVTGGMGAPEFFREALTEPGGAERIPLLPKLLEVAASNPSQRFKSCHFIPQVLTMANPICLYKHELFMMGND